MIRSVVALISLIVFLEFQSHSTFLNFNRGKPSSPLGACLGLLGFIADLIELRQFCGRHNCEDTPTSIPQTPLQRLSTSSTNLQKAVNCG